MQIIGIDIGTTTISGAVLEYENEKTVKLLEAKTIENGGFMPTANEWEKIQDAGAIVKKAEKLLDDLLDKYPQTERIGLTGQMHGIVYIDQTGTCVSPLYTWQDGRGSLCKKGQCSLVQEIKEKCDLEAASGYGLVTHICNLKHGPIPERSTRPNRAESCSPRSIRCCSRCVRPTRTGTSRPGNVPKTCWDG